MADGGPGLIRVETDTGQRLAGQAQRLLGVDRTQPSQRRLVQDAADRRVAVLVLTRVADRDRRDVEEALLVREPHAAILGAGQALDAERLTQLGGLGFTDARGADLVGRQFVARGGGDRRAGRREGCGSGRAGKGQTEAEPPPPAARTLM